MTWAISGSYSVFLSITHEYRRFCCSFAQSYPTLWDLMDCSTPGLPWPSPSSGVCPSSCLLHQWLHPAILFSDALFSCPRSFPASGTFPMSWLFTSNEQNTGALASVLPGNIEGWSSLRLTGLFSLLSKGLWGVFSSSTVQRHQFFGVLPSLWSNSPNHTWPLGRP